MMHKTSGFIKRLLTSQRLLVWTLLFAAVGAILIATYAALSTAPNAIEAEEGTIAGNAVRIDSSDASAGKAVRFDTPAPTCPSGACMPIGNVTTNGHTWKQVAAEDFTKDAALGSWGSACEKKIVYTGATGVKWDSYPACYKDTYQDRAYRADQVLSVHDGTLDFWLHPVDGIPAGANISPYVSATGNYQTYGRYEARFKLTEAASLNDYYQAWLLWPTSNASGRCAESDFPEAQLHLSEIGGFSHYCTDPDDGIRHQNALAKMTVDRSEWHTYTQEWAPGVRRYYIDGVLKGTAATNIWNGPMRWQLQNETKTLCDQSTPMTCSSGGHMLVDWAVVYAY